MKKITLYLSASLLMLFMSACQNPEPTVPETPKQEIKKVVTQTPTPAKDDDFNEENYVDEDEFNRVFTECFATGSLALKSSCKIQINKFLKSVPLNKKRIILIQTHTDKGSSNKNNLYISKKRAFNVASSLYYKEYKHSKVYYKGVGEEEPLYNLRSKEADRANRRIVVQVRELDSKIENKKSYFLYEKKVQSTKKKIKQRVKKEKKQRNADLRKYTGKADIGWIYFGQKKLKKKFEISCVQDKPRKVKRKSVKGHAKEEFMSGLHLKNLSAKIDKDSLNIAPISVYDNGYIAKTNPNIVLTKPKKSRKVLTTIVNTYNGEKGMLYRVFINKKNSPKNNMECMDLVFSYEKREFVYGVAYFKENKKSVSKKLSNLSTN